MTIDANSPRTRERLSHLILIGLVAGIFSTLFGVGGGTVMVPLMVLLLAYDTKVATATSLAAIIVTASVGVSAHAALGNVDWAYALLIGVPAVAGLLIGLWIKERLSVATLTLAFAVMLIGVAAWMLIEQSAVGTQTPLDAGHAALVIALGVCAGILAGLFGVGGGILFVPALALVVGLPQITAVGTSLLAIVPVSLMGSWRQHRAGTVRWHTALTMGAASTITAVGGSFIADITPGRALRLLFAALMIFTATQLFRRARADRARSNTHESPRRSH